MDTTPEIELAIKRYLQRYKRAEYLRDFIKYVNTGKLTWKLRWNLPSDYMLGEMLDKILAAKIAAMKQVGIAINGLCKKP